MTDIAQSMMLAQLVARSRKLGRGPLGLQLGWRQYFGQSG